MYEFKVEVTYASRIAGRIETSIEFIPAPDQEEAAKRIITMFREYGHKIKKLQLLEQTEIIMPIAEQNRPLELIEKPDPPKVPAPKLGRPKKALGRRIPVTVQLSDELLKKLEPYIQNKRASGETGYSRSEFIYTAMYELMFRLELIH